MLAPGRGRCTRSSTVAPKCRVRPRLPTDANDAALHATLLHSEAGETRLQPGTSRHLPNGPMRPPLGPHAPVLLARVLLVLPAVRREAAVALDLVRDAACAVRRGVGRGRSQRGRAVRLGTRLLARVGRHLRRQPGSPVCSGATSLGLQAQGIKGPCFVHVADGHALRPIRSHCPKTRPVECFPRSPHPPRNPTLAAW